MGCMMSAKALKVGDKVEARYENNPLGNYFPGTITAVREVSKGSSHHHGDAGAVLQGVKYKYDIDYDDGRHEKGVPHKLVRPVA